MGRPTEQGGSKGGPDEEDSDYDGDEGL